MSKKLVDLDNKLGIIEEKDNAVRTYAGMPKIDKDIRKLGIGGHSHEVGNFSDNLAPVVNKELALLEMDIQ